MHPTEHSTITRRSAERAALPPKTPTFPPAPERALSVIVDNLQSLGRRHQQGPHLEPDTQAHGDFQPSTKSALSAAMHRAMARHGHPFKPAA